MAIIGWMFGSMFKDAITTQNPFASASIFYYMLLVLFMPCNNQIGQRADTLVSFLFLIFCWYISKNPPKFIKAFLNKIA